MRFAGKESFPPVFVEEAAMKRRLFFVMPDADHALTVIGELERTGIDRTHVHALTGPGVNAEALPKATEQQQRDGAWRLERLLWNANLWIFAAAVVGCIASVYYEFTFGIVLSVTVMLGALATGAWAAIQVPDTHLDEFREALKHGEVLLMVDVPRGRMNEIEELVARRHPEAVAGGSSWSGEAFGM
jgi:hypothetical protein